MCGPLSCSNAFTVILITKGGKVCDLATETERVGDIEDGEKILLV